MNARVDFTIWKFPFEIAGRIEIAMPEGSRVLAVQMQGENPTLWALVNPRCAIQSRFFRIYGTGHGIPEPPGNYIGTVQDARGLVWHVFNDPDPEAP